MRKKWDFTHYKIAFLGYRNLKTTENQAEMGCRNSCFIS